VYNRTMPANSAAPAANTVDFQDPCGLAMDRAIGIEKASLDIKKKASWFAPVGILFKAATQAIASCIKLQLNWLTVRVPHALAHVSTVASNSSRQAQPTPDELAYSMDTAIGERFTASSNADEGGSGSHSQPTARVPESSMGIAKATPTPDELAYSMDIAIGERFTAPCRTVASSSGSHAPTPEVPEPNSGIAMAARA
jgi:hypothetical protein